MAKDKLEDLSLDKLRRNKKISVVLLWVLIVVAILGIIIMLRDFIGGKQLNYALFGSTSPCFFFALYFYFGIKKINGEISRRKGQ
jgi:Trk-type K+ transport system membrane component